MQPGDNIIEVLNHPQHAELWKNPQNEALRKEFLAFITYCITLKKTFFLQVLPGALAPVQSFIDKWKEKGLSGCTLDMLEAQKLRTNENDFISLNTMTVEEQVKANITLLEKGIQVEKTVESGKLKLILNDPNRILEKLFAIDVETLEGRTVYLPENFIFSPDGKLYSRIKNVTRVKSTTQQYDPCQHVTNVTNEISACRAAPDWQKMASDKKRDYQDFEEGGRNDNNRQTTVADKNKQLDT